MTAANVLPHPRLSAATVLLASAATLGGALLFQYVGGLAPCILCIWQRWPHGIAMVLALLALLACGSRPVQVGLLGGLLGLAGAALWIGAGIAAFHVGVEQHWWAGTPGCGSTQNAASLEELRAMVMNAPVVRCDQAAWSLAGVSMAGWNFLISLALGALAFAGAARAFASERP